MAIFFLTSIRCDSRPPLARGEGQYLRCRFVSAAKPTSPLTLSLTLCLPCSLCARNPAGGPRKSHRPIPRRGHMSTSFSHGGKKGRQQLERGLQGRLVNDWCPADSTLRANRQSKLLIIKTFPSTCLLRKRQEEGKVLPPSMTIFSERSRGCRACAPDPILHVYLIIVGVFFTWQKNVATTPEILQTGHAGGGWVMCCSLLAISARQPGGATVGGLPLTGWALRLRFRLVPHHARPIQVCAFACSLLRACVLWPGACPAARRVALGRVRPRPRSCLPPPRAREQVRCSTAALYRPKRLLHSAHSLGKLSKRRLGAGPCRNG